MNFQEECMRSQILTFVIERFFSYKCSYFVSHFEFVL